MGHGALVKTEPDQLSVIIHNDILVMPQQQKIVSQYCDLLNRTVDVETLEVFKKLLEERLEYVSSSSDHDSSDSLYTDCESKNHIVVNDDVQQSKINNNINEFAKISDYIQCINGFSMEDYDVKGVLSELESLGLDKTNGVQKFVQYHWFSKGTESYKFGRSSYKPHDPSGFVAINKLMKAVSNATGSVLDCCLVSYYHNGDVKTPPHSDNESLLDANRTSHL